MTKAGVPHVPGESHLTEPVHLVGRVMDASNAVFLGRCGSLPVAYKPIAGERPLWDFPDGCLAHRERAAYLIDAAAGFGIVPPTVLLDGPAGPGAVQWWVTDVPVGPEDEPDEGPDDVDEEGELFLLLPPEEVGPPWLPVFTGELPDGRPVTLAHADTPELRSVAVLDAVLNNSDRKGSHLLRGVDGSLWGIDHGVSLHEDDKLRTVLWGWAGEPLAEADLARIETLDAALRDGPLLDQCRELLTEAEVSALSARVDRLLRTRVHPLPQPGWPSVPWPAL
ncbi:MAG: SCO1664 family protein [Mobilicoccus sp.]|nr:SCO1664 family protein [Mobilicoccus sp.]